jgi:DNA replication protein DnaC
LGNLRTCDWVRLGHTLVITGESQVGKTYLAGALAREAALARLSVAYWRVPELLAACAIEKEAGTWPKFLKRLARVELLVLDDFATERADSAQSHLLRQLLDVRHRHRQAVMVVSPNAVEDWDTYFEDATAADAIFGRLLERSQPIALKRMPRRARR